MVTAYETAIAKRSDVELQIVQTLDAAKLHKLNDQKSRLGAHLEELELQVRIAR